MNHQYVVNRIEYYLDKLIELVPDAAERSMEARLSRLRQARQLKERQIADNFDVSKELEKARAKVAASNSPSLDTLTERFSMCQNGPFGCSYPACDCLKVKQLKPCRSPYCECEQGKCTHPGFFDARHLP